MEEILKKITAFADAAHGDQKRKYAPERYINHPIRVMHTCERYKQSLPVLAAALLHDVVEDTPIKGDEVKNFLTTLLNEKEVKRTMLLVIELTDVYTKDVYPELNRKKRKSKETERLAAISVEGQTIKYADIMDNSKDIGGVDNDFAPVYLKEARLLLEKMDRGNSEVRQEAMRMVDQKLSEIDNKQ